MPTIYWIKPTYRFPKDSSYAIRCWGYTGSTAQSTLNLHPGVSILQHITSLSRKLFTSDLRNASTIQAMAILPNYLPSTGWCRGYLATNRIGEIFDVGRLKYLVLPRYACDNNTPKLNSSGTGGIENNILVTRTSKQSQNTRGILKKNLVQFLKIEETRVVVRSPHQRERGWEAKKSYSPI